jgi:hypothetical protein
VTETKRGGGSYVAADCPPFSTVGRHEQPPGRSVAAVSGLCRGTGLVSGVTHSRLLLGLGRNSVPRAHLGRKLGEPSGAVHMPRSSSSLSLMGARLIRVEHHVFMGRSPQPKGLSCRPTKARLSRHHVPEFILPQFPPFR